MRPIPTITETEWRMWRKRSRLFKESWEELSPYMLQRSPGAVKRWVFEWGFMAGLRAAQVLNTGTLEQYRQELTTAAERAQNNYSKRLERHIIT